MDFMGMMKQAQAELESMLVDGESGGGLVKVTLTAKGELKSVRIDPSLLKADEKEILEDLIVSAHSQARAKADEAMAEKMKSITGGLQLPPGLKLPF